MEKLYVKQKVLKITDHYPILDERENEIYHVDQDFKLIGNTVRVSDARGEEIFVVDREVFAFLPRFYVRFADGREIKLQGRLSFLRTKIDIESDDMDLAVEGDLIAKDFRIFDRDGGREIGSVDRKILAWGDTYEITVDVPEMRDVVVAVMIAVDHLIDMAENS
ncbi:uncharacterized protein YxjI [Peptoniphilus ivorii]|uniref:LURP-one-related/scramblase family protein n=1 Tax=Aedoeadaptatus ivorii TaxID=54006 RepID=UPI00277EB8D1|nr:LURP-one-related family protein [Peptoniphilus ivorii]MDQ0508549.1 uncharacterized protein YxjI [Peptoniphilus ivorii]